MTPLYVLECAGTTAHCFSECADMSALCPARRIAPFASGDTSPHSKLSLLWMVEAIVANRLEALGNG
jgi:hypothetical protein